MDLSMGTSAPSTSKEKKSTVGFPRPIRMERKGKHCIVTKSPLI